VAGVTTVPLVENNNLASNARNMPTHYHYNDGTFYDNGLDDVCREF
jgi:hypothetical protein